MMDKPGSMIHDSREIASIHNNFGQGTIFVGTDGVTKIVIYEELGQCAYVPWAAVYIGEFLAKRIDMNGWGITYKDVE